VKVRVELEAVAVADQEELGGGLGKEAPLDLAVGPRCEGLLEGLHVDLGLIALAVEADGDGEAEEAGEALAEARVVAPAPGEIEGVEELGQAPEGDEAVEVAAGLDPAEEGTVGATPEGRPTESGAEGTGQGEIGVSRHATDLGLPSDGSGAISSAGLGRSGYARQ